MPYLENTIVFVRGIVRNSEVLVGAYLLYAIYVRVLFIRVCS